MLLKTITTTEPEWDDHERDKMLALSIYEAGICGCGCGVHESMKVPGVHRYKIDQRSCVVGASLDQFRRLQAQQDGEVEKQLEGKPVTTARPADGRQTFLRLVED